MLIYKILTYTLVMNVSYYSECLKFVSKKAKVWNYLKRLIM
jgi:hypothetical protein